MTLLNTEMEGLEKLETFILSKTSNALKKSITVNLSRSDR